MTYQVYSQLSYTKLEPLKLEKHNTCGNTQLGSESFFSTNAEKGKIVLDSIY